MFCPKCGSPNADETKFCRGCGADLTGLLAGVENAQADRRALSEKHIDLFSSGLRGLIIGIGFFIVSGAAFGLSYRLAIVGLFFLAFAFYFLGTGISRLVQAKALKALDQPNEVPALSPGQADYIKPLRTIYDTDDLAGRPLSVTENTTRHLRSDESE